MMHIGSKELEFQQLQAKIFNQLRKEVSQQSPTEPDNVFLDQLATTRAKEILALRDRLTPSPLTQPDEHEGAE